MEAYFDNTDRHFKGQQKHERVHCFSRKHPIILLRLLIIASLMGAGLTTGVVSLFMQPNFQSNAFMHWLFVGLIVLLTVTHHIFFMRLLNYYLEVFILTNYRIIEMKKSLFIHDDKEIIDLHEIQDIKKFQNGIWANLLGYGDLVITVATMGQSMVLPTLPRPEYYFHQINEAKRSYILDRRQQKFGANEERKMQSSNDNRSAVSDIAVASPQPKVI